MKKEIPENGKNQKRGKRSGTRRTGRQWKGERNGSVTQERGRVFIVVWEGL